jgi:D-cysteine desulfhydrase
VESALEIAQQCEGAVNLSSVVVASGSAGTHAGLAVGLEQLLPDVELIGVTVSRSVADQKKVVTLQAVANNWSSGKGRYCALG